MFKKNKIKTINKASIGDDDVLVFMVMMIIMMMYDSFFFFFKNVVFHNFCSI